MKFADPKNDLAFKKIFGNSQHQNILISFLNSVLGFKGEQVIVKVTLASPYQVPKIPELKETILDINATNQKDEHFIIEMQKKDLNNFAKRSLYYTSKAYVSQLPQGTNYAILKKVYFIGILNFEMFENDNYISRHLIINQETQTQDLTDFEFSFIELPKFNKDLTQLNTLLDKWIFFIKNASDLSLVPEQYQNIKPLKEAFDIATQTAWNKKELEIYEYMNLKEFDEINALEAATQKGFKEGIEKGIEQRNIEIAQSLLDILDNETIATKTGLSIEAIQELRK